MKLAVELLPSHWACFLVNGDCTGYSDEDEDDASPIEAMLLF